jgi:Gas vesicle protein G
MSQARFQKQQREKARRDRAAAKWAKRTERAAAAEAAPPAGPTRDQAVVVAELAALHESFQAGEVDFEEFETTKQRLVDDLDVG